MTKAAPANEAQVVRRIVLGITIIESAAFLQLAYWGLTETGWKIMTPIALAAAFPFTLFVIPALVLAAMNRLLWLALGLSISPAVLLLFSW